VRELAPAEEVRRLTVGLVSGLLAGRKVGSYPLARPDLRMGEWLYAANCAACHGPRGGGDGFADPAMDPPPSSFRDARMNLLSPHQVVGATRFGIDGTGMPAFEGGLGPQHLWDVAFYVMTLRDDFDPAPAPPTFPLTLDDIARHSNEELIGKLAAEGTSAVLSDIDHYRGSPPHAGTAGPASAPAVEPGDPLAVALSLQDAFARVAERVLPSVVTVSAFERAEGAQVDAPVPSAEGQAWQVGESEALLYPGFRRTRSGSGFVVSADGLILTCHDNVIQNDERTAPIIDVELPNGRHVLSRLVGAEPTINLAVIALEVVSEHRPPQVLPVTIGNDDAVRVGHWTIGVGDPWGPERAYAVGTLAAPADRACYQEQLSATLMQASLTVPPEAYGGPLVNIRGEVVGMLVPSPPGGRAVVRASEFALPIGLAMNIQNALVVAESRRSPWLGCSVLELAAVYKKYRDAREPAPALPRTGVYIDDVFEPSPASRAGMRIGDSLVSIDGHRLFSVLDFQKWLYLSGIGKTVRLEISRDGRTLELEAPIEERPSAATTR
jgi:serine protease Do